MAAPQLNLDLSAIAIGSPRVPEPIATALAAVQTTINSLGNVHIAADAAIAIAKTALGTYTPKASYASTVVGFSGTPTQAVAVTQLAKHADVSAQISGTSNNSSFTFTVPFVADGQTNTNARVMDNGVWKAAGTVEILDGTSVVNVYIDSAGGGFVASGTKAVQVTFRMAVE